MISMRTLAITAIGFVFTTQPLFAQDLSRYRDYTLGSSLASVVKASGARAAETKTLHERPAKIQELEFRTPYGHVGSDRPDPVHDIAFRFCDDKLYQVVVTYDRSRTEGLTASDIVESLTATYGVPVLASGTTALDVPVAPADSIVAARWDSEASSLTLIRSTSLSEFRLVLISKALSERARIATEEATKLDKSEAPGREAARRAQEVVDTRSALDKARTTNKAAFRP